MQRSLRMTWKVARQAADRKPDRLNCKAPCGMARAPARVQWITTHLAFGAFVMLRRRNAKPVLRRRQD